MLIIHTALLCEARPLIDRYRLKKDFSFTKFDVFTKDDITLIVSGIGRLKTTVAVTYLLAKQSDLSQAKILNVGIAGATSRQFDFGQTFLVNQIIDTSTGRCYYPDVLINHDLPENTLATFDKIVEDQSVAGDHQGLVDMEAAGFAAAALTFLGPHQITLAKIVSDHLDIEHLSADGVTEIVAGELPRITRLIELIQAQKLPESPNLPQPEQAVIDKITTGLKLTVAQQAQLRNTLFDCHLRSGEIPPEWEQYLKPAPDSKSERNRRFVRLLDYFRGQ